MNGPVQWLTGWARQTPSAPCVGTTDGWLSYAEVHTRVSRVRALLASLGVKPGDRVVLALPNQAATVVTWCAVQSLGATSVELDREWSELALGEVLGQVRPTLAIIPGRDARKWAGSEAEGRGRSDPGTGARPGTRFVLVPAACGASSCAWWTRPVSPWRLASRGSWSRAARW